MGEWNQEPRNTDIAVRLGAIRTWLQTEDDILLYAPDGEQSIELRTAYAEDRAFLVLLLNYRKMLLMQNLPPEMIDVQGIVLCVTHEGMFLRYAYGVGSQCQPRGCEGNSVVPGQSQQIFRRLFGWAITAADGWSLCPWCEESMQCTLCHFNATSCGEASE